MNKLFLICERANRSWCVGEERAGAGGGPRPGRAEQRAGAKNTDLERSEISLETLFCEARSARSPPPPPSCLLEVIMMMMIDHVWQYLLVIKLKTKV
jgi:hypothetical protein